MMKKTHVLIAVSVLLASATVWYYFYSQNRKAQIADMELKATADAKESRTITFES